MSDLDKHQWIDLCSLDQIPSEGGLYIRHKDRNLSVFMIAPDQVRIIDDACPHAGGSLSAGHLDDHGCVVCPWHAWAFDMQSGSCPDNPSIRVQTYPATVKDGRVLIARDSKT